MFGHGKSREKSGCRLATRPVLGAGPARQVPRTQTCSPTEEPAIPDGSQQKTPVPVVTGRAFCLDPSLHNIDGRLSCRIFPNPLQLIGGPHNFLFFALQVFTQAGRLSAPEFLFSLSPFGFDYLKSARRSLVAVGFSKRSVENAQLFLHGRSLPT